MKTAMFPLVILQAILLAIEVFLALTTGNPLIWTFVVFVAIMNVFTFIAWNSMR